MMKSFNTFNQEAESMVTPEPFLKTQQVASALGVSGATVKRWVDSGTIRAARTAGKHRLVPISEVRRIAREIGVNLSGWGFDVLSEPNRIDVARLCDRLLGLLQAGRTGDARRLILSASRTSRDAVQLADELIQPVMERIGHGWMAGTLDVYQEHEATAVVATAIRERIDELSFDRVAGSPLAIGAALEGDFYVLPCLLGELLLREQGWDVRNLGPNLPLRSLANATREFHPKLVYLSISYLSDEDRFFREYLAFHEAATETETAVILGGRGLPAEVRSRIPYSAFGDRMVHLAEFARRFYRRDSPPPAHRELPENPEPSRRDDYHE